MATSALRTGGSSVGDAAADDTAALEIRWQTAVDRGGRGDGAAALTSLQTLRRVATVTGHPALTSLAWSTTASLYRQAGRHADALVMDGRALAALDGVRGDAGFDTPLVPRGYSTSGGNHSISGSGHSTSGGGSSTSGVGGAGFDTPLVPHGYSTSGGGWEHAALVDAMVGLAADNLGLGRLGTAERLLTRAGAVVDRALDPASWTNGARGRLRHHWVTAELGLYGGRVDLALDHARAGIDLIAQVGDAVPERHRVKTELILAAATASSDSAASASAALDLADRATGAGLLPLEWAALSLQVGLTGGSPATTERLGRSRRLLIDRGMPFATGQ
ncbi:hypothetical protein GCM10009624_21560 [Gordonia sinesedis]